MRNAYIAFLVLGIVFISIGYRGQRTFVVIGLVFLIIALLRLLRIRA